MGPPAADHRAPVCWVLLDSRKSWALVPGSCVFAKLHSWFECRRYSWREPGSYAYPCGFPKSLLLLGSMERYARYSGFLPFLTFGFFSWLWVCCIAFCRAVRTERIEERREFKMIPSHFRNRTKKIGYGREGWGRGHRVYWDDASVQSLPLLC